MCQAQDTNIWFFMDTNFRYYTTYPSSMQFMTGIFIFRCHFDFRPRFFKFNIATPEDNMTEIVNLLLTLLS